MLSVSFPGGTNQCSDVRNVIFYTNNIEFFFFVFFVLHVGVVMTAANNNWP